MPEISLRTLCKCHIVFTRAFLGVDEGLDRDSPSHVTERRRVRQRVRPRKLKRRTCPVLRVRYTKRIISVSDLSPLLLLVYFDHVRVSNRRQLKQRACIRM